MSIAPLPSCGADASSRPFWTGDRLRQSLNTTFGNESVVVVSNREPFRHDWTPGKGIVASRSSGGLVTALEPVLKASSGLWIAHGGGTADRVTVDSRDGLDVSSTDRSYRLRRIWLDAQEERGYYRGFANEGLWALCHRAGVEPIFRWSDFETYAAVNARFGEAVFEEVESESPLVLVQDYHFALAPRHIREYLPLSTIVAFWHIPWPEWSELSACLWWQRLVHGLLGSSIVGFQTPRDCANFLDAAARVPGVAVNRRRGVVTSGGHRTAVRAYPVSIEWPNRSASESPAIAICRDEVRRELELPSGARLCVGVDRLDYTKGIIQKFLTVERLLERNSQLRQHLVLVQIAEPSRCDLPAYRAHRACVVETAERINQRFGAGRYRPIVLREAHHDAGDVYRYLRSADVCYVGSLHDGMNLVAKEFVCARDDEQGVLVLSRFAGAAEQLTDALVIDPYRTDECADTLAQALTMSPGEQSRRMRNMRSVVSHFNTYWWAAQIVSDAAQWRAASGARPTNDSDFAGDRNRIRAR